LDGPKQREYGGLFLAMGWDTCSAFFGLTILPRFVEIFNFHHPWKVEVIFRFISLCPVSLEIRC